MRQGYSATRLKSSWGGVAFEMLAQPLCFNDCAKLINIFFVSLILFIVAIKGIFLMSCSFVGTRIHPRGREHETNPELGKMYSSVDAMTKNLLADVQDKIQLQDFGMR